jgi:peptidoglycan/LPS O-acetylase OafA/YrhL
MLSGTSFEKPHLPSRTGRGYLPQLDALRFFAILGVLMAHECRLSPSRESSAASGLDSSACGSASC